MTDALYPVPAEWAEKALIDADRYAELYRESVEDPEVSGGARRSGSTGSSPSRGEGDELPRG